MRFGEFNADITPLCDRIDLRHGITHSRFPHGIVTRTDIDAELSNTGDDIGCAMGYLQLPDRTHQTLMPGAALFNVKQCFGGGGSCIAP